MKRHSVSVTWSRNSSPGARTFCPHQTRYFLLGARTSRPLRAQRALNLLRRVPSYPLLLAGSSKRLSLKAEYSKLHPTLQNFSTNAPVALSRLKPAPENCADVSERLSRRQTLWQTN